MPLWAFCVRTGGAVLVNLTVDPYPSTARAALDGLWLADLPIEDYMPPPSAQAGATLELIAAPDCGVNNQRVFVQS